MNKIITTIGLAMMFAFAGCLTWSYTPEEQKAFDTGVTTASDWYDITSPIPVEQDVLDMNNIVIPQCWAQFRAVSNGVYTPMTPKIVDAIKFRVKNTKVCNQGVVMIVTELDKLFTANPAWKETAKNKYMTYLNGVQSGLRLMSARNKKQSAPKTK